MSDSEYAAPPGSAFPPVLDACCGSRMFWFDKADTRCLYVDEASPGVPLVDWKTGKTNSVVRFPTGGSGDASERVRVVQTKRVTRLTFDWAGNPREIVDEEVLTETRTVLVRHETWIPR